MSLQLQNDGIDVHTLNTYCLAGQAFLVKELTHPHRGQDLSHIGIGQYKPQAEKVRRNEVIINTLKLIEFQLFYHHYQWMPLAMILSALAFYIPRTIWKWVEGGTLAHVCKGMAQQDLEEISYIEEIVGNDMSTMYSIDVVTPNAGQSQTVLGASSGTTNDPASISKETTINVDFHKSQTIKNVNRLLNFFRVFRVRKPNYATHFLLSHLLNAGFAILQVTKKTTHFSYTHKQTFRSSPSMH